MMTLDRKDMALAARAWPFEEAKKLLARVERQKKAGNFKGHVLFETGYGPSGLPHIGTFGEVVRTTMVRRAFMVMSDVPTRLLAFSDDMDGLRKVPPNVPNGEMLKAHLKKPLTRVPDPFGKFESFGHHNNAMLRSFLDAFGFEYEFASASDYYNTGRFDAALLTVLERYEAVINLVLPTLGPERRGTYSPFLPLSPSSGRVLEVPLIARDTQKGTITFADEDGSIIEQKVTGGLAKLQWKADWAMRWLALGIDYEMSGKDLIPSVELSSKIVRALGAEPPDGFNYELFLDDQGQKVSKTKGNGLTVDEWLRYASPESLSLFMFQKPRTAKRLYFDVIPRAVDDYAHLLEKFGNESAAERLENPVWHIHGDNVPAETFPVSFGLLLNLVSASGASDRGVLWGFIRTYAKDASPERNPALDRLVGYALAYYEDFVRPKKKYRAATPEERTAMEALAARYAALDGTTDGDLLQNIAFETGKTHGYADRLRDWFRVLYEVCFGEEQGPRFGSFAALFGAARTADLIHSALNGDFLPRV